MSHQKYLAEIIGDFGKNPPEITSFRFIGSPTVPPPVVVPPNSSSGQSFNQLTKIQQGVVTGLIKFSDENIAEKMSLDAIPDQNERNRRMIAIGQRENAVISKLNAYRGLAESARANDRTGVNPQVLAVIDAGKVVLTALNAQAPAQAETPASPSRADWSALFTEIKDVDLTKALMAARDRWDRANPR